MQKKWGIFMVAILGIVVLSPMAGAQTATGPQFLITWRASNSYVPAFYSGKILPNQQSQISASLEIISGGKVVNLNGQTIYWYLDDTLIGGGVGVQAVTFRPFGVAPDAQTLKVELPNYPGGILIHTITIPLVSPSAVIDAPYPQGQFPNSPVIIQALPYFFTASSSASLGFTWTVNGQTVASAENPETLNISLPQSTPAGFAVGVTLAIKNSQDGTSAASTANLTYQKQL